jgi:hypothetical protein
MEITEAAKAVGLENFGRNLTATARKDCTKKQRRKVTLPALPSFYTDV